MSAADDLDLLDDTTTTDAIPIATSLSDTQPTNLFTRMMDSLVMWMLQNPSEFLTSLFLFLIPLFLFGAYSAHRLIRELEHNDAKKQKLQRMHEAKRQIGKKDGKKSSKAD